MTRAIFYSSNIPVFAKFCTVTVRICNKWERILCSCNTGSLVALTRNVQSLYSMDGEDALWRELHGSSVEEGMLALGSMLLFDKEVRCVW